MCFLFMQQFFSNKIRTPLYLEDILVKNVDERVGNIVRKRTLPSLFVGL